MVKIILSGCGGAMGQVVLKQAKARGDCTVVAGIDPGAASCEDFPVFSAAGQCDVPADVIVDFSHPSALEGLLDLSARTGIPLVLATTGLSDAQIEAVHLAAGQIPVFFTFNMSLGINLMCALAKAATRVLGGQYDIEIIEKHHNRKIDAPSGTAIMLANAVSDALEVKPAFVYERNSRRQKREKNEIGLHTIRGGTIVGEHEVLFAGQDETLSIIHSAHSKEVFATGALSAAVFMRGKPPGMYSMDNLMADTR